MQQRIAPLLARQIGFAHRGARAHVRENTLEAFALALRLGANGLESDVWVTRDGICVLDHDGVVKNRFRSRPIAEFNRTELPQWIPTVSDLIALIDSEIHISLDVKDTHAMPGLVDLLMSQQRCSQYWLCHPDVKFLQQWVGRVGAINLVHSTRLSAMKGGPERYAASLAEMGVRCVNMPFADWNGGLVALFHRFNIYAFGWNLQFPEVIQSGLLMGLDGVFSDWSDRLADEMQRITVL
ncbi:MAG: hypothetical protein ABR67_00680 [Acidimicrobium sp. BACL17 MAG-120823-bin42]|nr:MAG: hypothetical protein ABR57_09005 [Acidimicrobium sp. BACL17 MAG-120924-bin0]KRO44024.1 MAG: hypothetical protein ABR67_00680 [Acidimicrobium sp. BACL17 MAG-120823-bin42]